MKKGVCIVLGMICLVLSAGCNKEISQGDEGKLTGAANKEEVFVSEDYILGSEELRMTDRGYYYCTRNNELRYIDFETGRDMYLCNKPECRHDGNEFCVATNKRYTIERFCLYNGKIIAAAVEETDTEYLYKVLSIALDGSEMSEIATYHTMVKNGQSLEIRNRNEGLYIHRNKVLLPLCVMGQEELDDTTYYGTAIMDLDTKEIAYLNEEPISKENSEVTEVFPTGDYFYYCKTESRRRVLYRYNIMNGEEEAFKSIVRFKGIYTVIGSKIFYAQGEGDKLCIYDTETGENEERPLVRTHIKYAWDGTGEEEEYKYRITKLLTDGTYLYVPETLLEFVRNEPDAGGVATWREACLNIFDNNGNVMESHDLVEELQCEVEEGKVSGEPTRLYFFGEEVYCRMNSEDESNRKKYVFRCNRSDLLAGNPKFEFVFVME